MLDLFNALALRVGDVAFGWLLAWSPSAALVVVAVGTSLVLTLLRKVTTNQERLKRVAADKAAQKRLLRLARKRRDSPAAANHRGLLAELGIMQLRSEGWPLLAALVPIALLATWCFQRLEYLPIQPHGPVEVVLEGPVSAIGQLVHLVPLPEVETNGALRRIEAATAASGEPCGRATWQVHAAASQAPYTLQFRGRSQTWSHALRVGGATYEPPLVEHDSGVWRTHARLEPFYPFGCIPGFDGRAWPVVRSIPGLRDLVLAPWLVGYLALVIPLALAAKPLLRIY